MKRTNMIIKTTQTAKTFKTTALLIALAGMFMIAAGSSSAFAQDGRGRDRDRNGLQDNRRDRDELKEDRREHDDWEDRYRERFEARRGYRDGLILGREDALEHRRFNPFRYPRFRFGSSDYREGFRAGYARAYRRFNDGFGFRFGRGF
jgi:hypothetical protein